MNQENQQVEFPAVDSHAQIWQKLWYLQQQIIELQKDQAVYQHEIAKQLATILDVLSQAKGGWKVFIGVGTAVTMAVGALAWIWTNFFQLPR